MSDKILWYHQPARHWEEALPVGNGRFEAMVFGGINTKKLQLNENTLWSGSFKDWNNPQAKTVLLEVRKTLLDEDYHKADELYTKMQGSYTQSYQPLGYLYPDFNHSLPVSKYHQDLDLKQAVAWATRFN